jgi:hypothetical protein
MNHQFVLFIALVAMVASCSKSPSSIGGRSKVFDSAPTAVKESWTRAVACAQTNGYAQATILLWGLRKQELTPAQSAAVEASLKTVMEAMYAAAERGDPAGKQAVEELKRRPRRE